MVQHIEIRRPDDFHVHLRDGDMLSLVAPYTARQFARALVMPNLKIPITTVRAAREYRDLIQRATLPFPDFRALMTCYLCDDTDPGEIRTGYKKQVFSAVKMYPAGATTHSDYGVTSVDKVARVLDVMQEIGLPLLIHGESTELTIDVFDREARFIDTTLREILSKFPGLKVVLEHITTEQAAAVVAGDCSGRLGATITPQHLILNRNAMFAGGLQPHNYCLPVLKREHHRLALRRAVTSGARCFFLGTDSAPHDSRAKEAFCGCAGIFSAPTALEMYLGVFEEEHALDKFEAFASENGSLFYGLPLNEGKAIFYKDGNTVPPKINLQDGKHVRPFMGGVQLPWRLGTTVTAR